MTFDLNSPGLWQCGQCGISIESEQMIFTTFSNWTQQNLEETIFANDDLFGFEYQAFCFLLNDSALKLSTTICSGFSISFKQVHFPCPFLSRYPHLSPCYAFLLDGTFAVELLGKNLYSFFHISVFCLLLINLHFYMYHIICTVLDAKNIWGLWTSEETIIWKSGGRVYRYRKHCGPVLSCHEQVLHWENKEKFRMVGMDGPCMWNWLG